MTDWKRAAAKHVRCGMSSFSCEVHHGLQGRCNPAKNNHFWVFCGLGALRIAPLVHHGLHPWCIVIGGGIWHRFSPPFLTYRALADENVAVISFHWTDGFVKVGSIKDDTHKSGHLHTFTQIHFHPNTNETCATLSTPRSKRHHWLWPLEGSFQHRSFKNCWKKDWNKKSVEIWVDEIIISGFDFFFDPTLGEYINIHIRSYPSHIPHTIIYYITLTPTSSILSVQKEGSTPQISYGLDLGRIIYKKGREENTTGRERTAMCAEVSKHTPSWCFGG